MRVYHLNIDDKRDKYDRNWYFDTAAKAMQEAELSLPQYKLTWECWPKSGNPTRWESRPHISIFVTVTEHEIQH